MEGLLTQECRVADLVTEPVQAGLERAVRGPAKGLDVDCLVLGVVGDPLDRVAEPDERSRERT
jgi:hypothetical protein